jgi:hypothetical protein
MRGYGRENQVQRGGGYEHRGKIPRGSRHLWRSTRAVPCCGHAPIFRKRPQGPGRPADALLPSRDSRRDGKAGQRSQSRAAQANQKSGSERAVKQIVGGRCDYTDRRGEVYYRQVTKRAHNRACASPRPILCIAPGVDHAAVDRAGPHNASTTLHYNSDRSGRRGNLAVDGQPLSAPERRQEGQP